MKDQNLIYKILVLLCMAAGTACTTRPSETSEAPAKAEDLRTVQVSNDQYKLVGIATGHIGMKALSGAIKVNGLLDVPPQNLVSISAPMAGFVKSTELLQGMKVTKGQVIAVLQNPEYIQLQQDFLDSKSQLEYLDAEYRRQQDLAKDNVNSQKSLQQAKAQYESMMARTAGLKARLLLLGIRAEGLTSETIQNTISVQSPITGYVTRVNVNIGMYVNPIDVMFRIVDTEHVHAELTVFEKDVPQIRIGQKVRLTLANETAERTATVYLVGREISEDRTVRIHCHLDREDPDLIPGTYLKAYVEAGTRSVPSLPDDAVLSFEGGDYIFTDVSTAGTHMYKLVSVTKGTSELGYTEINLPAGVSMETPVVIKGAYDLLAKLKNNEKEE